MVHALRGKEHVEWDNPYDVGMTGLIGFSSGYYAMHDCDILLMLGTDFPYRQFYPRGSGVRIAQVDLRPEQIGRRAAVDLGVVGDVKADDRRAAAVARGERRRRAAGAGAKHYAKARKSLDELAVGTPGKRVLHPQQVAKALSDHAAADAVFTCDVGLPTVWAARYLAMNGKRRLIGSFWHGSMANAMAQAIGAQAAFPGRQVISLSGDGGFSMLMGDFLSLTQLGLPVKIVVFNNGKLGFVELEQMSTGFLTTGTELENPNFAAMAEAAGVRGIRIEKPDEVDDGHRGGACPRRSGADRRGGRARGTRDAAGHHRRDGQRLYAFHGQGGVERADRRDHRPRAGQPLALAEHPTAGGGFGVAAAADHGRDPIVCDPGRHR